MLLSWNRSKTGLVLSYPNDQDKLLCFFYSQYITNNADLTCLTLSCQLGRDCLFKEMLELSCTEFWRYSNICCSAYPLGALDSIRPSGETSKNLHTDFVNTNRNPSLFVGLDPANVPEIPEPQTKRAYCFSTFMLSWYQIPSELWREFTANDKFLCHTLMCISKRHSCWF